MGKGSSKLHASPLVRLCKERKEFIKLAKYCRYDFVASFVVYLESLLELGNALNHYVEHEFVICGDCNSSKLSLPDFDPSEEDSFLESTSSSDLDSNLCSICHHSLCEEEESIGLHDTPEVHEEECCTCKHHSESYVEVNNMRNRGSSNLSSKSCLHHHGSQDKPHIHMSMSSEDHGHYHEHGQRVPFGNKWENPKSDHWFPPHMNQASFGAPMSFSCHDDNDRFVHHSAQAFPMHLASSCEEPQKHGIEQKNTANTLPIPPPPPPVSTWDFLYPFSMNYNVPFDNDLDVNEARVREGIPDLEDENETEQNSTTVPVFGEKEMESGVGHDGSCESDGTSHVTQLKSNEGALSTNNIRFEICKKEPKTGEDEWSEADETKEQCSEGLGTSSVTTSVASSRMGIKEAVLDIKNEFKYLFDCGKEFSSFMEVGKQPYHPMSTKLRAFASCFLRLRFPSIQSLRAPRARKLSKADMRSNQENGHVSFSDLSSTLEELYVREKKLYGEVMVEEKLQIPYDTQSKRLKNLDDRGCEFDKIDDVLASIKLLSSEINVAVASISAISRGIDGLRDNKLLPELNKLIEGLIRLWKVMSVCHQKQFQAISKAKSHVHILDTGNRKKSSSKATLRLERLTLKWDMCFTNFIKIQKAFVKHLNDWLTKHIILEETEKAELGTGPLSLSDIGAPPIISVCNDWYHAISKISESGVSIAIINFASSLHQLYEKQKEEQLVKVRVQHLFKDYKHRLKYFCKKNDIISHRCSSFFKMKTSEDFVEAEVPLLCVCDEKLAASRERLVEERKRHQEVTRHVNDIASGFLHEGLSPIFETLGSFCLENMKIYEQLRLPNSSSHE